MPAMVGIVARETPDAIARGFPEPAMAMTSKTSIIPVTVPKSPNNGHRAIKVFKSGINWVIFWRDCDTNCIWICLEFYSLKTISWLINFDLKFQQRLSEGALSLQRHAGIWLKFLPPKGLRD